ncbi:hypothetical protein [Micromonospora sp. WMMD812]|uniref:hypothetical protein n=1 Tax=Micromonospora sp. WMMD812 TaxID=3015152 RepID=UPI00248AA5C7|nr:hypothetical protein [Micromonospora sp. WMMD812]WBB69341.1 hypothetical protein O7603_08325 [Micromonospora sp. WMMD812]
MTVLSQVPPAAWRCSARLLAGALPSLAAVPLAVTLMFFVRMSVEGVDAATLSSGAYDPRIGILESSVWLWGTIFLGFFWAPALALLMVPFSVVVLVRGRDHVSPTARRRLLIITVAITTAIDDVCQSDQR